MSYEDQKTRTAPNTHRLGDVHKAAKGLPPTCAEIQGRPIAEEIGVLHGYYRERAGEMIIDTRPITKEEIKLLLPYTKEHKTSLWGQTYKTTPTLVDTVFGDGGSLITLDPTNSRPDYYIMLAPSNIKSFEDALEFISNNEELIYEPIELEFGNVEDDSYDPYDDDDPDNEPGRMTLNIGSGYTAGYFYEFKREK